MAANDGLFSALRSYAPLPGRDAREDYLTELFAWLLRNVPSLCNAYTAYLFKQLAINDLIINDKPFIKTQVSIRLDNSSDYQIGRIDMVIVVNNMYCFVCEHKVLSSLSDNQIDKYMSNTESLKQVLSAETVVEREEMQFCSVLLTLYRSQHTQPADISIIWSDVYSIVSSLLSGSEIDLSSKDRFLLSDFLGYLSVNGMEPLPPIQEDIVRKYSKVDNNSEDNDSLLRPLYSYFGQLVNIDWEAECPGISKLQDNCIIPGAIPEWPKSIIDPKFNKKRWGRCGIDFYDTLSPSLFVGVIIDGGKDHKLKPLDEDKGMDFVIILDSCSSEFVKGGKKRVKQIRLEVAKCDWYSRLSKRLKSDSGLFDCKTVTELDNPHRLLILRRPLLDILSECEVTPESQVEVLKKVMIEGINLILKELNTSREDIDSIAFKGD